MAGKYRSTLENVQRNEHEVKGSKGCKKFTEVSG